MRDRDGKRWLRVGLKRTQFSYRDPPNGEQTEGGRSGNKCSECGWARGQA